MSIKNRFREIAVAAFNVNLSMDKNEMGELSLANVEALAQEGASITCRQYSGACNKYSINEKRCVACGDPQSSCSPY